MHFHIVWTTALACLSGAAATHSFAGSNNYFLHGLPLKDQETYISTLSSYGGKLLRLWVTGTQAGCVKGSTDVQSIPNLESTVGTYDHTVLDRLDDTLALLHKYGMKAIISPHDANVINGANGCDAYCHKYGNQSNFYSSADAKQAYDNRLVTIFEYCSPHFNKPWSELSEAIWAFDIQNEPLTTVPAKLTANDPDDWLCGRAGVMRNTLGLDKKIAVATGGIGGSDYCCNHEFNLLDKALRCDAIDIMSVHGYMSKESDWAYFITGDASVLKQAAKINANKSPNGRTKYVMIEEWGVASSSQDNFNTQVQIFNDNGVPWTYWQVVPGKDQTQSGAPSSCGYDGYEIGLGSAKGDVKTAMMTARKEIANQTWTGFEL